MSNILANLNKAQAEAVIYNNGPLAIIAGAGSGKTRTITHKIAYLIQEHNIKPYRILAVTFTNKAAKEMKERIVSLIGEPGEDVKMYTYHALCARILREEIEVLGYAKNFNIIDNIDQKQILRPGYKKFDLSSKGLPTSMVIDFISENKNKGTTLDELEKEVKNDTDKALLNLYKFYLEETEKTNSVDFDDLLIFVNRLFKNHPEVAKKWADRFDYLLVDEFQDTSLVQYEIVRSLAPHNNITVVGDPNQTIYTWRYADANLILKFEDNFPSAKVIKLEQNYRSTNQVLEAANKLIAHNSSSKTMGLKLFTDQGDGDIIEYYHGFSEDAEARWVVQQIEQMKKDKVQLRDIAILFRANYLSQALEKALIGANLNYVIYGGVKFYQREEIKDLVSYLKIIANGDEVSLKRMINVPARKIGPTSQEALFAYAEEKGMPLFDCIIKHYATLPISESAKAELGVFINLIRKYRTALKTYPISTVLEKFIIEVKYESVWNTFEDQGRFENIKELVQSIKDWEKNNKEKTIDDYLTEVSLYTDRDESHSADYVSLMTVHTSKGLEFDNVFIFGMSEGVFPSSRSIDEEGDNGLEEERRLAYVATTRARKRLFISSSRGFAIDHKTQKKPSRFITELGINIKNFTKEFIAPKDFKDNYEENKDLIVGDKVMHEKFGQGVVVNISGDIAEIAFKAPAGVKSMMKNHKSIVKVAE